MSNTLVETVIELRPGVELRCPAFPQECSYVRITDGGNEVRYWEPAVWRCVPGVALGSLMGMIREYCPPLLARNKNTPLDESVGYLRPGVQIKSPSPQAVGEYVQVEVNGEEVGYWDYAEFREDPFVVMGALMGLLRKLCPPFEQPAEAHIDDAAQPSEAP